jgi:menaquinol-cytochrome c reductase iron-sulfur subunit
MNTDHGNQQQNESVDQFNTPADETVGQYHDDLINRRQFLSKLSLGLSALFGGLVGLPVIGFLVAPLLRRPPSEWQSVARVDQLPVGETVLVQYRDPSPLPWAGVTAQSSAWLRRATENEFEAFAINCTHLGCPVRWLQDASLFMCPCHGGVFYSDGQPAAGPPERPLFKFPTRVQNGEVQLEVGTLPIVEREEDFAE